MCGLGIIKGYPVTIAVVAMAVIMTLHQVAWHGMAMAVIFVAVKLSHSHGGCIVVVTAAITVATHYFIKVARMTMSLGWR